jgi:hypothetical protein
MTTQRRRRDGDIVTRGGLTRREVRQGYINATPEQNRAFALADLRESAEATQDAPVWFDNGESVQALANTARVLVQYVHVDMSAGTTEYRTVDGREGAAAV